MKEEVRQGWTQESVGWLKHAALIETWTRAATDAVIERAALRPGQKVLDVACGPGETAFAAARIVGPTGSVVATDLVPEMVAGAEAIARARGVANVSFRQADGEALPFPDASFDAVTCRHGIMFFPQPEKGLGEFRRVLKPGGRATLLAWGPLERNPALGVVMGPHLSRMPAPPAGAADGPGPFRFAKAGSLAAVMRAAGFTDVQESLVDVAWDFPGTPERFWETVQELSSSAFDWFREELSAEDVDAAAQEVLAEARRRFDGEKVALTAAVVLASGVR